MKTNLVLCLLCIVLCSCNINRHFIDNCSITVNGNSKNTIKGNGIMVTKKLNVDGFKALKCTTPIHIAISEGETYSCEISADENLLDYIKVDVKQERLEIYTTERNIEFKGIKMKITMPKCLNKIDLNGMCGLTLQDVLDKNKFICNISGMSYLSLEDVNSESIEIKASGMSDIMGTGTTKNLKIDNSGMSKIDFKNLHAFDVKCTNSGMGDIFVSAENSFYGNSSGMGQIEYYGNPKIMDSRVSGMGKIKHRKK